jgi:hypothetical protein
MSKALIDINEATRRINAGQALLLAGEEKLLSRLPAGKWIGGTIPYFMTENGGCFCQDKIFVTELPAGLGISTRTYSRSELPAVYEETREGEVAFIILPADSAVHTEFALNAPRYQDFAQQPLLGWIAGVSLSELGKTLPKVFCGGPLPLANDAAVLRLQLPPNQIAQLHIINLFEPGPGEAISFNHDGFSATTVMINGQEQNFAEYLTQKGADTRLPLVANYCGAMVNVSIKAVDLQNRRVEFYAPVVAGVEYRLAGPIGNYVNEFEARLKELGPNQIVFSCNCILNYLYSQLEGRRTGGVTGPITFGEIAYQLLNQTLVYLTVEKTS